MKEFRFLDLVSGWLIILFIKIGSVKKIINLREYYQFDVGYIKIEILLRYLDIEEIWRYVRENQIIKFGYQKRYFIVERCMGSY